MRIVCIRSTGLSTRPQNLYHAKLDELLDEGALLGSGGAATDTVKPAACTVLSELLYFMRKSLSIPQASCGLLCLIAMMVRC